MSSPSTQATQSPSLSDSSLMKINWTSSSDDEHYEQASDVVPPAATSTQDPPKADADGEGSLLTAKITQSYGINGSANHEKKNGHQSTMTSTSAGTPPSPHVKFSTKLDRSAIMLTLRSLEANMRQNLVKHSLTANHFKFLYDWALFLPSIILSLVGGILALSSSGPASDAGSANTSASDSVLTSGVALSVGIVSLVSVFWQSLTKQLDFGGRARLHDSAALSIKKLVDDLSFKQMDPTISEEELESYLEEVFKKYNQAMDSCDSQIPPRLKSAFYGCESEIDLSLDLHGDSLCFAEFGITRQGLYIYAWAELSMMYTNYRFFPLILPPSRYIVDRAMHKILGNFLAQKMHLHDHDESIDN